MTTLPLNGAVQSFRTVQSPQWIITLRENMRMNPCLNELNIGTDVKTSSMITKKALLYNAGDLRIDLFIIKPQWLLAKTKSMNGEQRFCHSDVRGRQIDVQYVFPIRSFLESKAGSVPGSGAPIRIVIIGMLQSGASATMSYEPSECFFAGYEAYCYGADSYGNDTSVWG